MVNDLALAWVGVGLAAMLLANGDFERGLEGWATRHGWYEKPKGAGLSEVLVAEGEGREA